MRSFFVSGHNYTVRIHSDLLLESAERIFDGDESELFSEESINFCQTWPWERNGGYDRPPQVGPEGRSYVCATLWPTVWNFVLPVLKHVSWFRLPCTKIAAYTKSGQALSYIYIYKVIWFLCIHIGKRSYRINWNSDRVNQKDIYKSDTYSWIYQTF